MTNIYYTYAHYKPNGEIFYIGKGKGMRLNGLAGRSKYWQQVVKDNGGYKAKILARWNSEDDALNHESFLISCFRDIGKKLVNRTSGGQRGRVDPITEETRQRMISAQKIINERRKIDPEWDKRIGDARKKAGSMTPRKQKEAAITFKNKFKNDPAFAEKISENRKKANKFSVKSRQNKQLALIRIVRSMRNNGKSYLEIQEKTKYSMGMISNIVNGRAYAGIS